MKFWRFVPGDTSIQYPSLAKTLNLPHPNDLRSDLFCSGHVTLPSGKLLLVGGEWSPDPLCQHVYSLDPSWSPWEAGAPGTPWTQSATMATERWYASAVPLHDGKVMAVAGTMASVSIGFGGLTQTAGGADTTYGKVRPLSQAGWFGWSDTTTVPADAVGTSHPTIWNDNYTNGKWPRPRDGHGFVADGGGRGILVMGRDAGPVGGEVILDDVWSLVGSKAGDDTTHAWFRYESVGAAGQVPVPRHRFAMTWAGVENQPEGKLANALENQICFIHGGLDAAGNVLGDLWRGERRVDTIPAVHYEWVWTQVLLDPPGQPRFGHTMMFDPGPWAAGAPNGRLVIFGGRSSVSPPTLADNTKLYVVGVGSANQGSGWQELTPFDYEGYPPAREGHAMTAIFEGGHLLERRYYLFGGQDANGVPVPGDLWYLARPDVLPSQADSYTWWRVDAPGQKPSGRTRAGMGFNVDNGTVVVVGGDTTGSALPGGYSPDVWTHPVTEYGGETWRTPPFKSFHSAPPPVAGMAFLTTRVGGGRITRSLERFRSDLNSSEVAPCPALPGQWETVTLQNDADSERPIADYPYVFQLPDGRLFNAGPSPFADLGTRYRRFFDFGTKKWHESEAAGVQDAARFGSAVMLRPGKFLRAGGYSDVGNALDKTETIDVGASQMPPWQAYTPATEGRALLPRKNHNLTLLPTGDVLVTGGENNLGWQNPAGVVHIPQLWRTAESRWNDRDDSQDTLAVDPNGRNYHSTAILLPDARVMTAGGEKASGGGSNPSETNSSIFEPPYLFQANGDYATRPRVSLAPASLTYGRTFTLNLSNHARVPHIRSIALMRPGAVTHGFDQNQRHVPLDFAVVQNPTRLLVKAPANGYFASPGDHMLFVVDNVAADAPSVPSMAFWTKAGDPPTPQDPADVTPPMGGGYIALSDLGAGGDCEPGVNLRPLLLGWKAPADDDTVAYAGKAIRYFLRFALNASPPANFDDWTQIPTAVPQPVFSDETTLTSSPSGSAWYRFALKTEGDNADHSSLSNTLIAKRPACESGGGGYQEGDGNTRTPGGEAFGARSASSTGAGGSVENSIFPGAPLGSARTDLLRFPGEPRGAGGMRAVYVREGGTRGLSLDRARLLAVDHAPGTETVADEEGELVAGRRTPALTVTDVRGRNVTAAAGGAALEPVYADSGEVLLVELPAAEPGGGLLLLQTSRGSGSREGVGVDGAAADGSWTRLGAIHPRHGDATHAVPLAGATQVRLRFGEACMLRFVGRLSALDGVTVHAAPLVSARGRGVDWTAQASTRDGRSAIIPARDTLQLAYQDVPSAPGLERDWYLAVDGTPVTPTVAAFLAREAIEEPSVPVAFALHQNTPNPFRRGTLIRFDLPSEETARLEVFDSQGRRVWSQSGRFPAGRHSLTWNLTMKQGRLAPAGIYTYRLSAGLRSIARKLVVLP